MKGDGVDNKSQEIASYTRSLIEASLDPLVTIASNGKITDVKENTVIVQIEGMTCNMCKMNVERAISEISGIEKHEVDLNTQSLLLEGINIDLAEIKKKVEERGYKYLGERE